MYIVLTRELRYEVRLWTVLRLCILTLVCFHKFASMQIVISIE